MTRSTPISRALTTRREALVHRLTTFRRQVLRHLLFAGSARVLAEVVGACILSLLLDRWLRLSLPMRLIFLVLAIGGLGYEIWKRILSPLQIRHDLVGMAAAIDRRGGIAMALRWRRASRRCSNYLRCSIAKRRPVPRWSSAPSSSRMIRCAMSTLNRISTTAGTRSTSARSSRFCQLRCF